MMKSYQSGKSSFHIYAVNGYGDSSKNPPQYVVPLLHSQYNQTTIQ